MTPLAFLMKVTKGTLLNHTVRDVCIEAMTGYFSHKSKQQKAAYERIIKSLQQEIAELRTGVNPKHRAFTRKTVSPGNYGKMNRPRKTSAHSLLSKN